MNEATTPTAILGLRNARRTHGEHFTLLVESLDVRTGEVLGIVGPTGSGKSTLLRMLAGLRAPDDGEMTFGGRPFVADRAALESRRRLVMVHQRAMLLTRCVRENVAYGLRIRGRRDENEVVDAMLERLGLAPLASQSAETLSGGQAQLVALARALVVEPDVLLLDEPTSHLDPAHVALVERTVADIRHERGTTIVWATHNHFQARRTASRTALVLDGRLVEIAETEAFFETPRDPRTADFVAGRMVY